MSLLKNTSEILLQLKILCIMNWTGMVPLLVTDCLWEKYIPCKISIATRSLHSYNFRTNRSKVFLIWVLLSWVYIWKSFWFFALTA